MKEQLIKRLKFIESCLRYETGDNKRELLTEKDSILKSIHRIKKEGRV